MEITEVKVVNRASDRRSHPKLYVFHEGENLLDSLVNRRQRQIEFYRNEVLPAAFKEGSVDRSPGCDIPGFLLRLTVLICPVWVYELKTLNYERKRQRFYEQQIPH